MDINIPKEATQIRRSLPLLSIDKWYCPDCGASGEDSNLDYIKDSERDDNEGMRTYLCGECFEENLYFTFIKED